VCDCAGERGCGGRNWALQGKNDDEREWTTIRVHVSDGCLPAAKFSTASWDVAGLGRSFQSFRIMEHLGDRKAFSCYLHAAIELYGVLSPAGGARAE